jgi:hypothetical protein
VSQPLQLTAAQQPLPASAVSHARPGRARRPVLVLVALVAIPFAVALICPLDSLASAGVFGKGANDEMLKALRAVVAAMTSNMLGFVGATIGLVVIGLGAAHIFGDERAHEKTLRVVKGIFYLVIASGFVA